MSFTHRLLRQLPKPYDGGSLTSDTDEGLQEFPQLSTLKRKGADEKINCFAPSQLPDEIVLRLNLKLIPMPTRPIMPRLTILKNYRHDIKHNWVDFNHSTCIIKAV